MTAVVGYFEGLAVVASVAVATAAGLALERAGEAWARRRARRRAAWAELDRRCLE